MRALICCIREMVRVALVRLNPVYIDFSELHNPLPDKTCIVSFVRLINIGFLTSLSLSLEQDTMQGHIVLV
jgi:hypothetical protein